MSFFKNQKIIDLIGRITAIAAVIIFIISCGLDLYSYSITPTATPTPSNTPTVTRTPRPTITASATVFPPTNTPQPTPVVPEYGFFQGLTVEKILIPLVQADYICEENVQEETTQRFQVVCQKTTENTFESIIILSPDQVQVQLITADLQKAETTSDSEVFVFFERTGEIILSQVEIPVAEIAPTASQTPQESPQPEFSLTEMERYNSWLTENLFAGDTDSPVMEYFSGIPFTLFRSYNHVWLEIGYIEDVP